MLQCNIITVKISITAALSNLKISLEPCKYRIAYKALTLEKSAQSFDSATLRSRKSRNTAVRFEARTSSG